LEIFGCAWREPVQIRRAAFGPVLALAVKGPEKIIGAEWIQQWFKCLEQLQEVVVVPDL
jgi:hypothetical protein